SLAILPTLLGHLAPDYRPLAAMPQSELLSPPPKMAPIAAPAAMLPTSPLPRYGASALARFASGSDCSHTLPGPVSAARHRPSPNRMFRMPFRVVMSNSTVSSNMPTWPGDTRSVSPGFRS